MTATATASERLADKRLRAQRAARGRLALLALGGASMIVGLDAALVRLEVWAPVSSQRAGDVHGLLMALGFLGTLIALERAQALGSRWAYLAPGLLGAGALALLTPAPLLLGELLLAEGCALFVAVYVALWRRTPRPLVAVQVMSAVLALTGAIMTILAGIPAAVPALIGFIVLTIASERAELAHLAMGPKADQAMVGLTVVLTAAILAATTLNAPAQFRAGERLLGLVLIATAATLLWRDIARRQLRMKGQNRYLGAALSAGYVQLAIAGAVLTASGLLGSSGSYDVVVHGVFLGFAVSMLMAHAPIILPAVLGRPLPYHPALWVPLVLLHGGLAVRFAGAALGDWRVGGVVTVVALLAFAGTAVALVTRRDTRQLNTEVHR